MHITAINKVVKTQIIRQKQQKDNVVYYEEVPHSCVVILLNLILWGI